MRPWLQWTIGAGLVVAAWLVAAITPPIDAREAPFPVEVQVAEPGVGRNIRLTVRDVHVADSVSDSSGWAADGNWLVVDLTAEARVRETAASLSLVEFSIDGATYSASERPSSFYRQPLAVGIPRAGSVAFELPATLTEGDGVITFGLASDPRLDSVIELRVDLGTLPHQPDGELEDTEWANG